MWHNRHNIIKHVNELILLDRFHRNVTCCESENQSGDVVSVRHEDLRAADSSRGWFLWLTSSVKQTGCFRLTRLKSFLLMLLQTGWRWRWCSVCGWSLWWNRRVQFVFHFSTDWSWTPLTAMFDVFTWSSPWSIDLIFTLVYLSDISWFKDLFVPYLVRNIAQKEQITVFRF